MHLRQVPFRFSWDSYTHVCPFQLMLARPTTTFRMQGGVKRKAIILNNMPNNLEGQPQNQNNLDNPLSTLSRFYQYLLLA